MLHLHDRALISALSFCCILLPDVAFSQVTIKEKVEIKPKQTTAPKRLASQFDFFSPPLFINTVDRTGLTLASSLTLSGTVSIGGQISPGHFAKLVWQEQEQPIWGWVPDGQPLARKGVSQDGQPYFDETPRTGIFNQIDRPVINLYTFDDQFWGMGGREIAVVANGLEYTFSGAILEGPLQLPVPVSATAAATGSFLEWAKFHSWHISAYPEDVTCGETSRVSFVPLDGSGNSYEPFGVELMSSTITLSVQANGDYAFLRCGSQEGKQITIPYPTSDPCDLVLDTYRGDIPGDHDIATVTIDGGGASTSVSINLMCLARNGVDHLSIEANPRSLPYGGISILTVKALDEHNQEVTPPTDFNVDLSAYVTDDMYMSARGSAVPGKSLTTFRKKPFAITQGKHPLLPHPQSYSGSFSVDGGTPEGDYLTIPFSVAKQGRVAYVADGLDYGMPTRDSTHVAIGVEMTDAWWETYGETNVVVRKGGLDHFVVTADPNLILHGESSRLAVVAVDGAGKEVTIGGNTSLSFSSDPAGYGTFEPASGITYDLARAGGVRFVSNGTKPPGPGPQQLTIGVSGLGKSGSASLEINKKVCEDASQCPDVPAVGPTLSVLPQPNGFGGIYVCNGRDDLGGFKAISSSESDKFIQPIAAVPCFDPSSDKLKFSVAGNSIQLNAVMDLCDDNIKARGQRLIFDLSEIAAADSCRALQDLRGHYHYPVDVTRPGGYMMADILMMHEMKHKSDYEAIVRGYQEEANRIFGYFQISCKSVTDIAVEQKKTSAKMTSMIAAIVRGIMAEVSMKWGAKGSAQRQTYEEVSTHGSLMVRLLIDSRIEELKAKYHCP